MSRKPGIQLDVTTPPASPGLIERNKIMQTDLEYARSLQLQLEQEEMLSDELIAHLGQFDSPNRNSTQGLGFGRTNPSHGRRLGTRQDDIIIEGNTGVNPTTSNTNTRPRSRSQDLGGYYSQVTFNTDGGADLPDDYEFDYEDNNQNKRNNNHRTTSNAGQGSWGFNNVENGFEQSVTTRSFEYTPGVTPEAVPVVSEDSEFNAKEYVSQIDSPPTPSRNRRRDRSNNPWDNSNSRTNSTHSSNSNSGNHSSSSSPPPSNTSSHESSNTPSTLFSCPYPNCNERYSYLDMYSWPDHVARSHDVSTGFSRNNTPSPNLTLTCPLCALSQDAYKGDLLQHVNNYHSQYITSIAPQINSYREINNYHPRTVPTPRSVYPPVNLNYTPTNFGGYSATNTRRVGTYGAAIRAGGHYYNDDDDNSSDDELYAHRGRGAGGYEEVDVDRMDYEQLHELAERIGKVETKKIIVERFPMREWKRDDKKNGENVKKDGREEGENCLVCFEDYEAGDMIRSLPCMHGYHRACIDRWIVDEKKTTCPVCKYDLSQ